jgi:DNA-binding PadR family transcriptional regulator
MEEEIRLTPTSCIVLGFVGFLGEATPYDIKRLVAQSVGHFWTFPHSQLYAEPERLTRAGYLEERREESGRRRKIYSLTTSGREAMAEWLARPTADGPEVRDLATLQLFFGADPGLVAEAQLPLARSHLAELESVREAAEATGAPGPPLTLRYGIAVARAALDFWEGLAAANPSE